ncbi:MAG: sigma 54-interacting transcriptional regulator [Polyangiaceae bacterium]|nr:sigma 54-interacting transcriptional regulator [Polyangiaceae bacterium]MCB9608932.1 sigma 54-interacting transcriptional regulator [Polyangiaceae bacterium]
MQGNSKREVEAHTTQLDTCRDLEREVEAAPEPTLSIVFCPDNKAARRELSLSSEQLLIGREAGRQGLNLADPRISRLHLRILSEARGYRLVDMNSSNGTYVNGQRVGSYWLQPGDVVRAGNSMFVFGLDDPMMNVRRRAARGAASDLTVLLEGETGTGKEVLARFIHETSARRGRFIAVNCATLPRDLIAAELFGHTRGAFSGAGEGRPGLFVSAAKGSLFLDEIGELPLDLQPALLRALQERAVRPVGSDSEVAVDARIIAATNVTLEQAVNQGRFRADLFARLAELPLKLPPLRQRRREILGLALTFARNAGRELELSPDAAEGLLLWDWPYNVRELESLVRSFVATEEADKTLDAAYLHRTRPALVNHLADRKTTDSNTSTSGSGASAIRLGATREQLRAALSEHSGNVSHVAKALGKPRAQIYRWLKSYGLDPESFR